MTAELHVARSSQPSQESTNGIDDLNAKSSTTEVINESSSNQQQITIKTNGEQPKAPSALEQLAKNLDEMGKQNPLLNEVNPNDIIAFKVFMPSFQLSEYIIGMVESFEDNHKIDERDFDITLLIMGKNISFCFQTLIFKYHDLET